MTIPKVLLKRPHFNLGQWYAQRLGDTSRDQSTFPHLEMGRPLAMIARKLLEDQNYVRGFNVCVAPSLVEPSVRDFGVSECSE